MEALMCAARLSFRVGCFKVNPWLANLSSHHIWMVIILICLYTVLKWTRLCGRMLWKGSKKGIIRQPSTILGGINVKSKLWTFDLIDRSCRYISFERAPTVQTKSTRHHLMHLSAEFSLNLTCRCNWPQSNTKLQVIPAEPSSAETFELLDNLKTIMRASCTATRVDPFLFQYMLISPFTYLYSAQTKFKVLTHTFK